MNKEMLLKKAKKDMEYAAQINTTRELYNTAWGMIDDIEKLDELEKPVTPSFVAEWFEENKDCLDAAILVQAILCSYPECPTDDFRNWFRDTKNKPIETIIRMKEGYTVEEEKHPILKAFDDKAKEYDKYQSTSQRLQEVRKVLVKSIEEVDQ